MAELEELMNRTFPVFQCNGCTSVYIDSKEYSKHLSICVRHREIAASNSLVTALPLVDAKPEPKELPNSKSQGLVERPNETGRRGSKRTAGKYTFKSVSDAAASSKRSRREADVTELPQSRSKTRASTSRNNTSAKSPEPPSEDKELLVEKPRLSRGRPRKGRFSKSGTLKSTGSSSGGKVVAGEVDSDISVIEMRNRSGSRDTSLNRKHSTPGSARAQVESHKLGDALTLRELRCLTTAHNSKLDCHELDIVVPETPDCRPSSKLSERHRKNADSRLENKEQVPSPAIKEQDPSPAIKTRRGSLNQSSTTRSGSTTASPRFMPSPTSTKKSSIRNIDRHQHTELAGDSSVIGASGKDGKSSPTTATVDLKDSVISMAVDGPGAKPKDRLGSFPQPTEVTDCDKTMRVVKTGDFMCRYLASREFADAVIKTDIADIPVHKVVLASRYPQLSQCLLNEGVIDMSDISYGHVSSWLKYIYANDESGLSNIPSDVINQISRFILQSTSGNLSKLNSSEVKSPLNSPVGSSQSSVRQVSASATKLVQVKVHQKGHEKRANQVHQKGHEKRANQSTSSCVKETFSDVVTSTPLEPGRMKLRRKKRYWSHLKKATINQISNVSFNKSNKSLSRKSVAATIARNSKGKIQNGPDESNSVKPDLPSRPSRRSAKKEPYDCTPTRLSKVSIKEKEKPSTGGSNVADLVVNVIGKSPISRPSRRSAKKEPYDCTPTQLSKVSIKEKKKPSTSGSSVADLVVDVIGKSPIIRISRIADVSPYVVPAKRRGRPLGCLGHKKKDSELIKPTPPVPEVGDSSLHDTKPSSKPITVTHRPKAVTMSATTSYNIHKFTDNSLTKKSYLYNQTKSGRKPKRVKQGKSDTKSSSLSSSVCDKKKLDNNSIVADTEFAVNRTIRELVDCVVQGVEDGAGQLEVADVAGTRAIADAESGVGLTVLESHVTDLKLDQTSANTGSSSPMQNKQSVVINPLSDDDNNAEPCPYDLAISQVHSMESMELTASGVNSRGGIASGAESRDVGIPGLSPSLDVSVPRLSPSSGAGTQGLDPPSGVGTPGLDPPSGVGTVGPSPPPGAGTPGLDPPSGVGTPGLDPPSGVGTLGLSSSGTVDLSPSCYAGAVSFSPSSALGLELSYDIDAQNFNPSCDAAGRSKPQALSPSHHLTRAQNTTENDLNVARLSPTVLPSNVPEERNSASLTDLSENPPNPELINSSPRQACQSAFRDELTLEDEQQHEQCGMTEHTDTDKQTAIDTGNNVPASPSVIIELSSDEEDAKSLPDPANDSPSNAEEAGGALPRSLSVESVSVMPELAELLTTAAPEGSSAGMEEVETPGHQIRTRADDDTWNNISDWELSSTPPGPTADPPDARDPVGVGAGNSEDALFQTPKQPEKQSGAGGGTHGAYVPSPQTPMEDYGGMSDEKLKMKMREYGLRDKMSRKRMLAALTQIYAETHQYETDTSAEWTLLPTPCKQNKGNGESTDGAAITGGAGDAAQNFGDCISPLDKAEGEIDLTVSDGVSGTSSDVELISPPPPQSPPPQSPSSLSADLKNSATKSSLEMRRLGEAGPSDVDQLLKDVDMLLEDSDENASDDERLDNQTLSLNAALSSSDEESPADAEEEELNAAAPSCDPTSLDDLDTRLRNLIVQNNELYSRIISYQMIPRDELIAFVKSSQIKCSQAQLDAFCHKQCIPVQNKQDQKPRTRKKPVKKKTTNGDGRDAVTAPL